MAMDPKQERALRDGTASEADQPRKTDRDSVREQEENPPVTERPRERRRTTAVADVRVNLESGTPAEQLARELGGEGVPELGRARRNKRNGDTGDDAGVSDQRNEEAAIERPAPEQARQRPGATPAVSPGEARRTLKARREHSKGDGNFARVEPGPELLDERPEDRKQRDMPKARDDRSAPKGNVTAGQEDRNPDLDVRDDHQPQLPTPASGFKTARRVAEGGAGTMRPRPIAEAKNAASSSPRKKPAPARAERGTKPTTARATRTAKRQPVKAAGTRSGTRRPTTTGRRSAVSGRTRVAARGGRKKTPTRAESASRRSVGKVTRKSRKR